MDTLGGFVFKCWSLEGLVLAKDEKILSEYHGISFPGWTNWYQIIQNIQIIGIIFWDPNSFQIKLKDNPILRILLRVSIENINVLTRVSDPVWKDWYNSWVFCVDS